MTELEAELAHDGGREVDDSRPWPETVAAYAEMMDPSADHAVGFTVDSDREVVRFIFYRVCSAAGCESAVVRERQRSPKQP